MPCNGKKDNYQSYSETIDQLHEIVYTYQNSHDVNIGRDFNENAKVKSSSKRSVYLHKFIEDIDFVSRAKEHTFIHPMGVTYRQLTFSYLNTTMANSAKLCTPGIKPKQTKKSKLRVNSPIVQAAIYAKKNAFLNWKQQGTPPTEPTNFYLLEKKLTTSDLRKKIRLELARRKSREKNDIIHARQSDNALFQRRIRKRRGKLLNCVDELYVGDNHNTEESI